jgi:hypothetical protein
MDNHWCCPCAVLFLLVLVNREVPEDPLVDRWLARQYISIILDVLVELRPGLFAYRLSLNIHVVDEDILKKTVHSARGRLDGTQT